MAFFNFAEGAAIYDSTPIENIFLLEHLPTAPEGYLRVYLYARMLALHPELGGDMADMARTLHLEEDAVYNAFRYWEQQGLVRRLTDRPPTYELLPVHAEGGAASGPAEREYYDYRDFNAALQALFGSKLIESHEYRVASEWLNVLGYEQEAVLRLVRYGISRSRSKTPAPAGVFKRMDKLAVAWADRGCRTAQDVERAIAEDESIYGVAQAVLKRFSIRREPTLDELDCARRWVEQWRFTQEQILEACSETTKSAKPSFAYLDAILKSRLEGDSGELWRGLSEVLRELDAAQAQPTPDLLRRYAALLAAGFEAETVRLAAVQCRRKKKTTLEEVEWMLNKWAAQGIYTRDAAEAYIQRMQARLVKVRALLEATGLERRPTMSDLAMYERWQAGHDEAVIDFAAQCARGMQVPMKYMDRLLSAWADEGVRTVDQARASHEAARAARAAAPAADGRPANPALDYEQREYSDEDFGDDFYFDLKKYADGRDGAADTGDGGGGQE